MQYLNGIKNRLTQHNYHYLLLLLFFCLNGFRQFWELVGLGSFLSFFIQVALTFMLLSFILNKISRNDIRNGIVLFYFMFLFLFFGNLEDSFSEIESLVFLSEPLYFIPFILLVSAAVVLFIKNVRSIQLLRTFINTILLFWLLAEMVLFGITRHEKNNLSVDDVQLHPVSELKMLPVYFVILDEYGGDSTLLHGFGYDNSYFKSNMKQLGFRDVPRSSANYPLTVHSLSSTLDMDYLPDRIFQKGYAYGYKYGLTRIRLNKTAGIFSQWGYRIRNYSFFDFTQAPADFSNSTWGGGARVLAARCMHIRLYKHLVSFSHRYHFGFFQNIERDHHYNQIHYALNQTLNDADRDKSPSFNFIHILSPHKPFLFDSLGNKLDYVQTSPDKTISDKQAYIWSVQKINRMLTEWSEQIIKAYSGEVVLLIMSDHGPSVSQGKGRRLDNLNLVYVPGRNSDGWYDGMSNVNQFRILFNTLFGQHFPILKDRVIPKVPGDQLAD